MKTGNKLSKKDRMYKRIQQHGENLKKVFRLPDDTDEIALCKKLRSAEIQLQRIAENYCNGDIDMDTIDNLEKPLMDKVKSILKPGTIPIFFNRDPRGYALKIDDIYMRENNIVLYRDWGGYGILAPDFSLE
jgi:hypothetical protein